MFKYFDNINFLDGDAKMIYFAISYLFFLGYIICELLYNYGKLNVSSRKNIVSLRPLWVLLMVVYALVGIITNDPFFTDLLCNGFDVCYPATYEWMAYMTVLCIMIWLTILSPMSKDINILKDEGRKIEGRLGNVEGNIDIIKKNTETMLNKCLNSNCKKG